MNGNDNLRPTYGCGGEDGKINISLCMHCVVCVPLDSLIILSYAFKMRQDYLSTSYLDQKYLPSERSERGRYELIQVTCAEIILSHF